MLGQLRTVLVARPVTADGLAAVYRYRDANDVRRALDALIAAGLITKVNDDAVQATASGRDLLIAMYGSIAVSARALWARHDGHLPVLSSLAGRLVQAGMATAGAAYSTVAPPYELADSSPELLLHTRLSVLRYHRADAHAAAWRAAGQTGETMARMPEGATREAIEAETNRRAGVPYATISADERLTLLAGLAALPG